MISILMASLLTYFDQISLNIFEMGECLYYKDHLPIIERKDLVILPETIVAKIRIKRKKIFIVLSYCHPNTERLAAPYSVDNTLVI